MFSDAQRGSLFVFGAGGGGGGGGGGGEEGAEEGCCEVLLVVVAERAGRGVIVVGDAATAGLEVGVDGEEEGDAGAEDVHVHATLKLQPPDCVRSPLVSPSPLPPSSLPSLTTSPPIPTTEGAGDWTCITVATSVIHSTVVAVCHTVSIFTSISGSRTALRFSKSSS